MTGSTPVLLSSGGPAVVHDSPTHKMNPLGLTGPMRLIGGG